VNENFEMFLKINTKSLEVLKAYILCLGQKSPSSSMDAIHHVHLEDAS
jgi:hypothetical protein